MLLLWYFFYGFYTVQVATIKNQKHDFDFAFNSTAAIPGVYISTHDKFPLGDLFQREIQIRMGQCPVKKYNEQLLHLIEVGRINPLPLISHTMSLDEAPKAYDMFDSQKNDVTKVVLKTDL